MDADFISQLLALAKAHSWVALAALVIGLLVRLVRDDSTVAWFPFTIPARWRPLIALGLGIVSGVLNGLLGSGPLAGVDWPSVLVGGVVSAVAAMGGHAILINAIRNGRELGESKAEAKAPGSGKPGSGGAGAAMAGAIVFCFALLAPATLPGCAAVPVLVTIADTVAIVAPYAAQIVDDVDHSLAAYFAAHPDPAKQALVDAKLEGAKLAALGLGQLGAAGKEVSEKDYLDALAAFSKAFDDLYTAVRDLDGVQVVPPSLAKNMKAKPGVTVIVMPAPGTFAPKGAHK